VSLTS